MGHKAHCMPGVPTLRIADKLIQLASQRNGPYGWCAMAVPTIHPKQADRKSVV